MSDLLHECNDQRVPPRDFKQMFCDRCRNPQCDLAGWKRSLFDERISTQAERLLNPIQVDPKLPKYAQIASTEFKSMLEQAMRIEISNRKQDWNIPEIAVVDGRIETASLAATRAVDEAVRNLGRTPKREPPKDDDFSQQAEAMLEVLAETKDPEPEKKAVPVQPPPVQPPPAQAAPAPFVPPKTLNTLVPAGGLMIGGGPSVGRQPPSAAKPVDPWAPPSDTVRKVEVGAKVRMGKP